MALLCVGICCCAVLHTECYHPFSEWEMDEMNKANLWVYPNDVRPNIVNYFDTLVAWPGLIKEDSFYRSDDQVVLELLLEHRYYDWLEDYGMQREKIFLSPRGEGLFKTTWLLKPEAADIGMFNILKKTTAKGNLVIVYGYPDSITEDSIVFLKSTYIRPFPKGYFRCDMIDYGRPGPFSKHFSIKKIKNMWGACCIDGCAGIGSLAALGSLSFLGFGDEVLGGYWACGSIVGFNSLFERKSFLGPAFSLPMILGCAGLSYYNFAYGDKDPKVKVFLVNTLSPIGIGAVMILGGVIFPSAAFKTSNSIKFDIQSNGVKLSYRF